MTFIDMAKPFSEKMNLVANMRGLKSYKLAEMESLS